MKFSFADSTNLIIALTSGGRLVTGREARPFFASESERRGEERDVPATIVCSHQAFPTIHLEDISLPYLLALHRDTCSIACGELNFRESPALTCLAFGFLLRKNVVPNN